jgi:hypothetical protein
VLVSEVICCWMMDSLIPGRNRDFFYLCHHIQTGSGTHTASYPMGTGTFIYGFLRSRMHGAFYPHDLSAVLLISCSVFMPLLLQSLSEFSVYYIISPFTW